MCGVLPVTTSRRALPADNLDMQNFKVLEDISNALIFEFGGEIFRIQRRDSKVWFRGRFGRVSHVKNFVRLLAENACKAALVG
jgi:hypothetical protein